MSLRKLELLMLIMVAVCTILSLYCFYHGAPTLGSILLIPTLAMSMVYLIPD